MKISLAGINVPVKALEKLPEDQKGKATPEVISAAYARISRSLKNVDELLEESMEDISRARKSNQAIIYGMGHHSVADHVIFNINIRNVSRLLMESIQKRRLAGYTEKSQRYVTMDGDYVKPAEYSAEDLSRFEDLVRLQNEFYFNTYSRLMEFLKDRHSSGLNSSEGKEKTRLLTAIEGSAKEDARYSLSLATETQLGCTYTGETAELAIRELRNGRTLEEKEFARLLYEELSVRAPSVIQLTDPELFRQHNPGQELADDNFKYTDGYIRELVGRIFARHAPAERREGPLSSDGITILSHNDPDRQIIAAILHHYSHRPACDCYSLADDILKKGEAEKLIRDSLKYISRYDKLPRAFEPGFVVCEMIVSAGCYGQLKRHRMNTLLAQDYDPALGYTIPPSIIEIGAGDELSKVCDTSSVLFREFLPRYGKAAEYCLTNAHRKRVILAANIRQFYHISRTRQDIHAQWEIRERIAGAANLIKKIAPVTSMLMGGQHEFGRIYDTVMGK
ncbi:MAG: FAD-dependent thymidylate synthase [Elusimicrobia bacterium]|nr:FAD-dependent thymidylate synthase [Elusimicrobiota bacterium]